MSKLMKKFLQFSFGGFIASFLGLIATPILTRIISEEEFGKASLFNTYSTLCLLVLTLGLEQAYIRFCNQEEKKSRGRLLKLAIKYPLILNIFFSVLLLIFYKPMSTLIIGEISIKVVMLLIVANTLMIINRFNLVYVRMQQKGTFYSFLQIAGKIAYILSIFITYLFFKDSYLVIILSNIFSTIAISSFALLVNKKSIFKTTQIAKPLNTNIKEMLRFGAPLIISTSIIWVFQSIDKLSLQYYFSGKEGDAIIGIYTATFSLVAILNVAQVAFSTFFVPVANEHYSKNPEDKGFFVKMHKLICLIMFCGGGLAIILKDVVVLFLGSSYRDAKFIFPFLLFIPIMYSINETTVVGISFKKRTDYNIIVSICSAVTNLVLNMILVPKFGAQGAAISTGISYIMFFAMGTYFSRKVYKVNYKLSRFTICTILLCLTALYATFNSFDIILLILGLLTMVSAFILYDGVKTIKKNILKIK